MSTSPMPHLDDFEESTRKPYERQAGVYLFVREPYDTEMHWTEPQGDTYLLSWEEGKRLMRILLEASDEFVERVCDSLFNFYHVACNFDLERFVNLRQEKDGWEEEYQLAFYDSKTNEGIPEC